MSIFTRVNAEIKINKKIREDGGFTCIPWNLPRLSTVLPGVQRARYVIVTANSKQGKTQLADFLYVHQPFEFYLAHKDANIIPRILYFSLEMSKEDKILGVLSYKLYRDHGIIISPEKLLSVYKNYVTDDKMIKLIDSYNPFFEEFEQRVTYIDNIRNPYGIFKYVQDYADKHGSWVMKDIDWEEPDGSFTKRSVKDYYVPNDPRELVIVMTDHISLLSPEKGQTLHDAMGKFSSDYCLHMRDKFKYCVVNIQQQAAAQEKQQFTLKGDNIVEKLKPSAEGLGDNKLTGRDCDVLIGLFGPWRFNIPKYEGFDLRRLQDYYREMSVIINRRGNGNQAVDLFFNGASNYFEELPPPSDMTEIGRVYKYVESLGSVTLP